MFREIFHDWSVSKFKIYCLPHKWFDFLHEALFRKVWHSSGGFDWKIICFGPCIIILTVLAWLISIPFSIVGFKFVTNHTVARLSVSSPYSVCSTFSNYAFDNFSSASSNTFFSVTALVEYSDKGLNHEFFSRRGILPSKIHWFRSLPSQSPDSLNFPKKCLHDCSSLEFKLIFLRKPGLLSYIRISTWNVTLVGQYFFWNPLFPSWQQNPENPRILWFDIVFDHYKFKLILLNYRFDLFHEGSIDNFILPEEELDKTVCILILWFVCFHEALNREV